MVSTAQAGVYTIALGQSLSCDDVDPGSVIIVKFGNKQSTILCSDPWIGPTDTWICYTNWYGTNSNIVSGTGSTKKLAIQSAIENCYTKYKGVGGACQTAEIVIGPTCEQM